MLTERFLMVAAACVSSRSRRRYEYHQRARSRSIPPVLSVAENILLDVQGWASLGFPDGAPTKEELLAAIDPTLRKLGVARHEIPKDVRVVRRRALGCLFHVCLAAGLLSDAVCSCSCRTTRSGRLRLAWLRRASRWRATRCVSSTTRRC